MAEINMGEMTRLTTQHIKNLIFDDFRSRKIILKICLIPFLHFLALAIFVLVMLHSPPRVENKEFTKQKSPTPKNAKTVSKIFSK